MKEYSQTAIKALHDLEWELISLNRRNKSLNESFLEIGKAAATAKMELEKALKKPELLNEAVCKAIDLLRSVTPYTRDSGKTSFVDPPLTKEEKTLPN